MALKNKEAQALIDLATGEGLVVGLACTHARTEEWHVSCLISDFPPRGSRRPVLNGADIEVHMHTTEVRVNTELGHIFICELAPTACISKAWGELRD